VPVDREEHRGGGIGEQHADHRRLRAGGRIDQDGDAEAGLDIDRPAGEIERGEGHLEGEKENEPEQQLVRAGNDQAGRVERHGPAARGDRRRQARGGGEAEDQPEPGGQAHQAERRRKGQDRRDAQRQ